MGSLRGVAVAKVVALAGGDVDALAVRAELVCEVEAQRIGSVRPRQVLGVEQCEAVVDHRRAVCIARAL